MINEVDVLDGVDGHLTYQNGFAFSNQKCAESLSGVDKIRTIFELKWALTIIARASVVSDCNDLVLFIKITGAAREVCKEFLKETEYYDLSKTNTETNSNR